jgi:hypothetical protein
MWSTYCTRWSLARCAYFRTISTHSQLPSSCSTCNGVPACTREAVLQTERAISTLWPCVQRPALVDISGLLFHRHHDRDELLLSYLKCVRAVSSLNASLLLLDAGHVFEVHTLCRCIDECSEDVWFFAEPDGEDGRPSENQRRAFEEFFQKRLRELEAETTRRCARKTALERRHPQSADAAESEVPRVRTLAARQADNASRMMARSRRSFVLVWSAMPKGCRNRLATCPEKAARRSMRRAAHSDPD